ncbi:hypothetical protein [Planctomicrobium piriforme]|uniref:Phytanoyl-CoA dioxygenase (PhyH) n=1 Tax=Planctomicrobium piriforme TaxID=1576369 RepID=A0A1I3CJY0_9PLAN|nr:hypothetical protein [Planctomicrobium piriforme]SFH74748.1 hypothetical protein SAMN05421753_102311 [Planctomicrobium piriforme]
MADVMTQPISRSEVVTPLARLSVEQLDPRQETPLFAAGLDFARETAGPIATAFLDALPNEWIAGHLVIDSTLVWLPAGFRQGPMFWCHEPFPGRTDGVTGQSNLQRAAEHIACCCGPTGIEFLIGDGTEAELHPESPPLQVIHERHVRLQAEIDAGRLSILTVPPDTLYRYRWGAFHRHEAAASSGFQFWIRATRGDDRPLVNGIRNATNL